MRSVQVVHGRGGRFDRGSVDAFGDLVNTSRHLPAHRDPPIVIAYHPGPAADPGIHDGDIWYTNDALCGGIHNPDQVAIMPSFSRAKRSPGPLAAVAHHREPRRSDQADTH